MYNYPTLILYILIILVTTYIARKSQSARLHPNNAISGTDSKYRFRKEYLYLAFLIHWFFIAFTDIGTDHEEYLDIIQYRAQTYMEYGMEVGFNGLSYILYNITHSGEQVIFILKTITLLLFYVAFYRLRFVIDFGLAFFVFNTQVYFQGYYLLSMQLAISLIFLAYALFIYNKYIMGIVLCLIACTVHSSAMMVVPLFLLVYYYNKKKESIKMRDVIVNIILILLIISSFFTILSNVLNYSMFEQYGRYELTYQQTGSGLMVYFNFAILLYIIYHFYRQRLDYRFLNQAIVFALYAFCFALIGYKVDVFSRMNKYFVSISMMSIPILYKAIISNKRSNNHIRQNNNLIVESVIKFYLLYNGILTLNGLINLKSTSDIAVYHLFNPFI